MQVNKQVFANQTTTGTSNGTTALGASHVTAFVVITGTAPSVTFQIQGSDDGTNYVNLTSASATTASIGYTSKLDIDCFEYYRLNISAISGTTPSVNAWISAEGPAMSSYA